jgi:lipopolysaccharide transport system permease protein
MGALAIVGALAGLCAVVAGRRGSLTEAFGYLVLMLLVLVVPGGLGAAVAYVLPGVRCLGRAGLLVAFLGIFSMGVAWILSALGVFLRDLAPLMQFFSVLLMFISGVFYSVSKIPADFSFLRFNPLAVFVETARGALLWNISPTSAELLCLGAISMVTCLVGYALFANLKSAFADVL